MSHDADITLRAAGMADLADVADLFLACWRTSYVSFLPAPVVSMFGPDSARALWRRSLCDGQTDVAVLVAERANGSVVGVLATGRDPDRPVSGHIFSLYVHPDAQGLGIGARLMSAALDRFRSDGLTDATLWVFEANVAARGFYERLGWHPDGATRIEPQYGEPELRLSRSVSAARPPRVDDDAAPDDPPGG